MGKAKKEQGPYEVRQRQRLGTPKRCDVGPDIRRHEVFTRRGAFHAGTRGSRYGAANPFRSSGVRGEDGCGMGQCEASFTEEATRHGMAEAEATSEES